jgi:cytochrome c553
VGWCRCLRWPLASKATLAHGSTHLKTGNRRAQPTAWKLLRSRPVRTTAMSKTALMVCLGAMTALAAPRALKSQGIQVANFKWNLGSAEQTQALKLQGDRRRGAEAYQVCGGCHQGDGAGQFDGVFPRLAGQHASVIIKQLADIRLGRRDNPIMYPYASTVGGAQELADLGAYIETMKSPGPNGHGPGRELEQAARLFTRDCAQCHGVRGEGDGARFVPKLAGQHYRYLLRQAVDIRTGARRNVQPEMARLVRLLTPDQLSAVTDYASRLDAPEAEARR